MASADAAPLEPRQRVPGGPTGGVSVLLHAGDEPDFASSSRPSAHVAYPSGDAVVVAEIRAGNRLALSARFPPRRATAPAP